MTGWEGEYTTEKKEHRDDKREMSRERNAFSHGMAWHGMNGTESERANEHNNWWRSVVWRSGSRHIGSD